MTYQDFKAKYPPGVSVASPENTYKGECVSYDRQYMAQVQGVVPGPLGNAVDFATNPTFLKFYERVSTPQVGDIMVWGDDVGTWTGPAGHIAIYDGDGYMMNQNYNGSRVVSRNKIFTPGFIGYYRLKGGTIPMNDEGAKELYRLGLHREPENDTVWRGWVGKQPDVAMKTFRGSTEYMTQNHILKVAYPALLEQVKQLQVASGTKEVAALKDKTAQLMADIDAAQAKFTN